MVDMKNWVDSKNENRGFATWGERYVAFGKNLDFCKQCCWLPTVVTLEKMGF